MNFVGHAHVASAIAGGRRAVVLGAMLPDFASMCGVRLLVPRHPELAAGVALHHRTDDAFHACAIFVRMCASAAAALEAQGMPRGAARAAAHVGIEMLLDGVLLGDESVRRAYLEAVRTLDDPAITGAIRLQGRGSGHWPELIARLRAFGPPDWYADPKAVADRLIAILASRPRLAVDEEHRFVLQAQFSLLRPLVERQASALVAAACEGNTNGEVGKSHIDLSARPP